MTDMQTASPAGIAITSADTGPAGIRASIVDGECFGRDIVWDTAEIRTVTVSADPKTGKPVLRYPLGRGLFAEYRGLEPDGITWWRHEHETDPAEYREHCLRVVALG